jgi:serine/threonine-protein kinase
LQYGLARQVLLWLMPALAMILVADLLLHGDQPLLAVLRARGWAYAALGALALVAHTQREQWLGALDRRFFRERYDAQKLLRDVAEEARQAGDFQRVAPLVVARIEAALHPEFAALVVREPGDAMFRTLASSPAGQAPASFPAESKLMALVRLLGKPVEVSLSESGWLKQQLPHQETEFLRQARVDLLVPIAVAADRKEALLALGMKRSEEPYSREDQDLLVAVASSVALLLERPAAASRSSEAFQECPQCGACYDSGMASCAKEGATLTPVFVPRMVSGRYRLERRLGRGGMGTVYEATDTALERRVAAKLIREDLVGSAEAAERFRREARAAAGFAHPNVVTVHDFGMSGNRAFLVMELLEGISLREELRRHRRLPAAHTREVLRGVCAAVDAAHRRQLIHRDLKPENIFLARGESGESAKVLDFGLVKSLSGASQETADTSAGILVGTLRYMSPDQFRGEAPAPAWDLWALGVVAYELLTGQHPFGTGSGPELHAAVLGGRFTPVAVACPDAPSAWQEFFLRALAQRPEDRPHSAQVFFSELEHALGKEVG